MGLRTAVMTLVRYKKMHLLCLKSSGSAWETFTDEFYKAHPELGPPHYGRLKTETLRQRVRGIITEVCEKHDVPRVSFDDNTKMHTIVPSSGVESNHDITEFDDMVLTMGRELVAQVERENAEKLLSSKQKSDKAESLFQCERALGLREPALERSALTFGSSSGVPSQLTDASQAGVSSSSADETSTVENSQVEIKAERLGHEPKMKI